MVSSLLFMVCLCRYRMGVSSGEFRLDLRMILEAFRIIGVPDMDMDQVECLTTNLIFHVSIQFIFVY